MAYTHDLPAAARRLLDAGAKLEVNGRPDVAGYLFGLAAECAIKAMAERLHNTRRMDIFLAHFPDLRTLVRDAAQGRAARPLLLLLEHDAFMNEWSIHMRYAPAEELATKPVKSWGAQAARAVNLMNEVL